MGKGFNNPEPGGADGMSNTWLTPPFVIESLGPFDIDPCAAPYPRPWNCATINYTEEDDGLTRSWEKSAFVFCNPPYGRQTDLLEKFLLKLASHPGGGIGFIFARTETRQFQNIVSKATSVLFPRGRFVFHTPDGTLAKHNAGTPSVFIAFGDKADKKIRTYQKHFGGLYWPVTETTLG